MGSPPNLDTTVASCSFGMTRSLVSLNAQSSALLPEGLLWFSVPCVSLSPSGETFSRSFPQVSCRISWLRVVSQAPALAQGPGRDRRMGWFYTHEMLPS